MKKHLNHHSAADELVRLKKSLQFIREVVDSYGAGLFDHIGFSCALAISKAEELREHISPFCPARHFFDDLIRALKRLYYEDRAAYREAKCQLDKISTYFNLDRYFLTRRPQNSLESTVHNQ